MTLTIFMFFVLVCLPVAVGIIACRHGLSKGYEQNVNNNIELEKALRGKERELKEEQKLSEDYREEIKRQAHDLRIMNNCNLGLNERLNDLEEVQKMKEKMLTDRFGEVKYRQKR